MINPVYFNPVRIASETDNFGKLKYFAISLEPKIAAGGVTSSRRQENSSLAEDLEFANTDYCNAIIITRVQSFYRPNKE